MSLLNTERLALRQFQTGDAGFVIELLNEESFMRHIGDKGVRTLEDAHQYLNTGPIASYDRHGFGLYHVECRASGMSIGMCGLLIREDRQYPDIGYALLKKYTSNGFAAEAAAAVLDYGHNALRLNTIDALVNPDNDRSISLLQKLGMKFHGTVRVDGIPNDQNLYRSEAMA